MGWRSRVGVTMVGVAALSAADLPVAAADLGGNCCADLEERIAELEATTAHKGNRKVSLEISGHVNEAVMFWDDGDESNAYVVTNDNSRTRFRFKGTAKINTDWEAGYLIEIGVRSANSKRSDQIDDEGLPDVGFDIRDSVWFLKSKTYGTGYVGLTSTATDAITEINLSQTSSFSKYADIEDSGLGMFLRREGSQGDAGLSRIEWRRLIGDAGDQPGEGEKRYNVVKYETPAFAGFSASAAWGEDDFWDVALRYAGEFHGVKIAAGFGYGEQLDGPDTQTECAAFDPSLAGGDTGCHQFGGSISILHEASGVFFNVAAGRKTDDLIEETAAFAGTGVDDSQHFWAVQAGVERKLIELGKTTVYGEYYSYDGGGNQLRPVAAGDAVNPFPGIASRIFASEVAMVGAGLAQGVDAAAMTVYLSYRHYESDLTVLSNAAGAGNLADAELEDLDIVMSGAIVKF